MSVSDDLVRDALRRHLPYSSRVLVGVAICRQCGDGALWPCDAAMLAETVKARDERIAALEAERAELKQARPPWWR